MLELRVGNIQSSFFKSKNSEYVSMGLCAFGVFYDSTNYKTYFYIDILCIKVRMIQSFPSSVMTSFPDLQNCT